MNNHTKQLNRLLAILTLTSILPFVPANHASAGFLDWFSGPENESSTSQTFDSFANFLSTNDPTIDADSEKQNLSLLQNNSLVSTFSPLAVKITTEIKNAKVKSVMTVRATAYSSTPDQTDSTPFVTAMGTQVRDGIIAANFLPFGTKIRIPRIYGAKIFVVEDRMNRRYWHVVDVWFPDRASAMEFGNRTIEIEILES